MTVRVIACEDSAAQARRLGEEHGLDGLAFELWEPPVSVGLVYEGATTPWRWAQLPGLESHTRAEGAPIRIFTSVAGPWCWTPFADADVDAWLTSERRQP